MITAKKGASILERGIQVHFMAEFQEILDFPPAAELDVKGKFDPKKATPTELRGHALVPRFRRLPLVEDGRL